jgi:hypothetical protein
MGKITRAVIEFSEDISPALPLMQRLIEGCGYNPEAHVAAFRFKDMGVIVERNKIIVNNADTEAMAQTVIDFLKDVLNASDEIIVKVEVK